MSQCADKCRLCGQAVHQPGAIAPGYQLGNFYVINECEGCMSSFAAPLEIDDSLYDLIYANARYAPGYNRYFSYAQAVLKQGNPLDYLSRQEESYWAVARHVKARRGAGEKLKILEVGCGMGYFSYALARSGFNVKGIDLSPNAVAWAREHYGDFYECCSLQALYQRGERYDVIVMNQLIEHIPDVHQFMAQARALLASGGELVLTTPNKSAYPGLEWETELPPIHLWWFGEKTMDFIAQHHGLKLQFIDFTPFYDAFVRVKAPVTSLAARRAVFDEQGRLLAGAAIPSQSPWRPLFERTGAVELYRRAKMLASGGERWQGARGPICACVLSGR